MQTLAAQAGPWGATQGDPTGWGQPRPPAKYTAVFRDVALHPQEGVFSPQPLQLHLFEREVCVPLHGVARGAGDLAAPTRTNAAAAWPGTSG